MTAAVRCTRTLDIPAMGGNAHVILVAPPTGAAGLVQHGLQRLEAAWSRFRPDSDISRLNAAGGVPVQVTADTVRLVTEAVEMWHLTAGAFDPTVHDALVRMGYDRSYADGLKEGDPRYLGGSTPGCDGIVIDDVARTVQLPAGASFDAGGIGKGLAADILSRELMDAGCEGVCVNLAGDLRVRGNAPSPEGWTVAVDDPADPTARLAVVRVEDAGVASSSTAGRRWGVGRHHLIDPTSGLSARTDVVATTVIAAQAQLAEALTKLVILAGLEAAEATLGQTGAMALTTTIDGEVRTSASWPSV